MSWQNRILRFLREQAVLAAAGTLSVALLSAVVFGSRGLLHLRALRQEQRAISQRIAALLSENERHRNRLEKLRTDDRHLERLARQQLGLVRPGEIVYRFPDARPSAPVFPPAAVTPP